MEEKLSIFFTYEEMIFSEIAIRNGIPNVPDDHHKDNLILLCDKILDSIRIMVGVPVIVTSGYRSPRVNELIGGASTSQHCRGQAADIHVKGLSTEQLYIQIKNSPIPFDQLIQEFDGWVHVSYRVNPRHDCLRAIKESGRTVYKKDT